MATLDPKKTRRNLTNKGFQESNSDHKILEYFFNGRLILHTKISHNSDDIRDPLIHKMSVQCKLNKGQFKDLAICDMDRDEYFEILRNKGLLT